MTTVAAEAMNVINKLVGSSMRGRLDATAILARVRQRTRDPEILATVTNLLEQIAHERN